MTSIPACGPAGRLPGLLTSAAAPGTGRRPPASKVYPVPPVRTAVRSGIIRRGRKAPGQSLYRHAVALYTGDRSHRPRRSGGTVALRCERPGNVKALAGQRPWAAGGGNRPQRPGKCWPRGTTPLAPPQSSRGDVEVVRLEAVRGYEEVVRGHVGHRDRDQGRERVQQLE